MPKKIQSIQTLPFNGTGIGSRLAPNLWIGLMDITMDVVDKNIKGMTIEHPIGKECYRTWRVGDCFVDDFGMGTFCARTIRTAKEATYQQKEDTDTYNACLWVFCEGLQHYKYSWL